MAEEEDRQTQSGEQQDSDASEGGKATATSEKSDGDNGSESKGFGAKMAGMFKRDSKDGDSGSGKSSSSGPGALTQTRNLIASVVRIVFGVLAGILVLVIVFKVTGANRVNPIVEQVFAWGSSLVGPFDGLLDIDNRKLEVGVNWGIAALVYFAVGALISTLVRR